MTKQISVLCFSGKMLLLLPFFLYLFSSFVEEEVIINIINGYRSYSYYHYNDEGIFITMFLLCFHVGFIMLPLFASTFRRLHDTGRRGEYIFIGLVPFFGDIALLVLLCQDPTKEKNEYSDSSKYVPMDINSPMALYNSNNVSYNPNFIININPIPNNMNSNPNNPEG